MTKWLLCEGSCGDVHTPHVFARDDVRVASDDKRILYKCQTCGTERQFGLEIAEPHELARAKRAA